MKKAPIAIVSALCGAVLANAGAIGSTYGGRYSSTYYGQSSGYSGDFFDEWIAERLSVGLSISSVNLTDNKRPPNREQDFLGNINELKQESSVQVFPTLNYRACDKYLHLGLSYAKVEARTMNFNNHESDGNASLKGPVFTAEAAYPLWDELAIPHIGLGLAFLAGDFDEDDWWGAGYGTPEDFESTGHDKHRYRKHRYIDVDDETCAFFNIGVSCRPAKNLLLDFSYRRLNLDPDCEFGYKLGSRKYMESTGDFDLSCDIFLFSVAYLF